MMKKLFLLLFAALALVNCKKSNDTNDVDISTFIKPKMVINKYENAVDTSFVFYNGNKIDSVISTHGKSTYEYSTDDIIVKGFRKNDQIPWEYVKYLYDTNKRVVKVEFYLNVNSDYNGWKGPKIDSFVLEDDYYTYDYLVDGSVKEQYLQADSEKKKSDYSIYKYDTHGNVATKINYWYIFDQYHISSIDSMEYDNKNHYFRNVDIPTFAPISSKINNIAKIKSTLHSSFSSDPINGFMYRDTIYRVTTQTFQYDNNGFPTMMTADGYSHTKSLIIKY